MLKAYQSKAQLYKQKHGVACIKQLTFNHKYKNPASSRLELTYDSCLQNSRQIFQAAHLYLGHNFFQLRTYSIVATSKDIDSFFKVRYNFWIDSDKGQCLQFAT